MLVTQAQARQIIRKHYGDDFKFRLSTSSVQLGVLPNYEIMAGRIMLAWMKHDHGKNSMVKIGKLEPTGAVDWHWGSYSVAVEHALEGKFT